MSNTYLSKLASLRFFAALMVVGHHLTLYLYTHNQAVVFLDRTFFWCGFTGVTVFYVLSGFVISLANERWKGWKPYLIGRVARIYPSHLLVTAILFMIPLYDLIVHIRRPDAAGELTTNLLLLHAWIPRSRYFFSLNNVTWSLSVEIFFYVCFILLRRLKDRQIYLLTVVGYISVLTMEFLLRDRSFGFTHWLFYVCPALRLPEFLMGMSAYRLYRSGALERMALPKMDFLLLFILMITTLAMCHSFGLDQIFLYSSIPSLFAFAILVSLLDQRASNYMRNAALVLLGESSFVLYLIHHAFLDYPLRHNQALASAPIILAIAAAAIGASVLIHLYIESKSTNIVKQALLKIFVKEARPETA